MERAHALHLSATAASVCPLQQNFACCQSLLVARMSCGRAALGLCPSLSPLGSLSDHAQRPVARSGWIHAEPQLPSSAALLPHE